MDPAENLPTLPFEIIVTILTMLPAQVLVRFMLVCKAWRDLIKDADFILMHLQCSASRGNNYLLFGSDMLRPGQSSKLITDESHVKVLEREIKYDFDNHTRNLISSSNGLVCFIDGFDRLMLWLYNPFIRKYKSITATSMIVEGRGEKICYCNIGFGYDSQANDYKIVRIIAYIKTEDDSEDDSDDDYVYNYDDVYEDGKDGHVNDAIDEDTEVEIYSLNTDSWKRLEVRPFRLYRRENYSRILVNDCLHWRSFSCYGIEDKLLSFDLGKEVFQSVDLPSNVYDDEFNICRDVVVYKDKLALVVFPSGPEECCHLWVMWEYGVFASWSLLFAFVMDVRVEWPFIFTMHDEIMFRDANKNIVVHNFLTGRRQNWERNIDPWRIKFFPLTNSLTLVDYPTEE